MARHFRSPAAERCLSQSRTRIKGKPPLAVLRTLDAEPCPSSVGISDGGSAKMAFFPTRSANRVASGKSQRHRTRFCPGCRLAAPKNAIRHGQGRDLSPKRHPRSETRLPNHLFRPSSSPRPNLWDDPRSGIGYRRYPAIMPDAPDILCRPPTSGAGSPRASVPGQPWPVSVPAGPPGASPRSGEGTSFCSSP